MKKAFFVTLAVVLMLLLAGSFFLGGILGRGIVSAVNSQGPKFTGTTVTLGSATLSPFTGAGTLRDLVVGNPEGYKEPHALSVAKTHVQVRPFSLLGETLVIQNVEIAQPRFDFETTLFSSNLKTILENVNKAAGGSAKPDATGASSAPARKIILHHFLLEDAQITVTVVGNTLTVPLARLELHDIGVAKGGVTPAEAAQEISKQVLAAVIESAKKAIAENPAGFADRAKDTGRKIGDAAKEIWEKATGP